MSNDFCDIDFVSAQVHDCKVNVIVDSRIFFVLDFVHTQVHVSAKSMSQQTVLSSLSLTLCIHKYMTVQSQWHSRQLQSCLLYH